LGSLTLGGYDASRSLPNNLTFSLAGNDSASPVVGIKSIAASDTLANDVTILSEGIIALIDTALPFIWLPLSACQVFENAFGLTWNDSKDLYLINQTSHQQLLSKDPSIDFILENLASGPSINITLPYSSFNLQASNPIFPNGTNYLPLKRATSPSQYTLGRTFMQEAFMFVDYEQGNFSISQAQFPSNPSPNLVTVDHSAQPVESSSPVSSTTKHSISHGALAGAVVGSLLAFTLLCAIAIFFFRRHRQRQQKSQHRDSTTTSKSSAPGKESWPSSPSNSQAPGYLSSQSNLESGSETLTSMDRSTEKPPSTVGELEDPMTAVTAPSINWPAPSRPRQELPGCDTAKELPPTPRDREKHIFELASSDARSRTSKS